MSKTTQSHVTLKPASGRRVRKPDGTVLAETGEPIDVDTDPVFWARRADDGDTVAVADGDDK